GLGSVQDSEVSRVAEGDPRPAVAISHQSSTTTSYPALPALPRATASSSGSRPGLLLHNACIRGASAGFPSRHLCLCHTIRAGCPARGRAFVHGDASRLDPESILRYILRPMLGPPHPRLRS